MSTARESRAYSVCVCTSGEWHGRAQSRKGSMRGRVMAAVAGNSRSKMRDLDRHGECSTQSPVRLRGPCTVIDGQSDVQRGSVIRRWLA
jgi:hypothetical protein